MAGNWYLGGVQRVEQNANAWIDDTLYASLVAGVALTSNDRGWTTMGNFTAAGNQFIELMSTGSATNVPIPGNGLGTRTVTFDTATDTVYWRWPAGQVSFGTPQSGQDFCGVLIHDGDVSTPDSRIWGYQRVTGQTLGGAVSWGEASVVNDVFTANARNTTNSNTGAGFMLGIFSQRANSWSGPSDIYEFALVQSGSTVNFRDWYSVQNAINAGIVFCTNCGFNGAANPGLIATYRDNSAYFGGGQYFYYPTVLSGVPGGLKWDGSQLSGGEQAIGVLGYVNTGNVTTSPIMLWNDISPAISLVNGQDVFWDSFDTGARTLMLQDLTGN